MMFNFKKIFSKTSMTYVVAEAGINHNGDIKIAKKMIEEASKCGANGIKIQTIFPEELFIKSKNLKLFKFHKIDINKSTDRKELFKIIKKFKPKVIVNYSAQGMVSQSWKNPEDWFTTNLVSQSMIYKNLSKYKFIKKIIHVSTPEVYGSINKSIKENYIFKPSTPYAISRAAMDYYLINLYKKYIR